MTPSVFIRDLQEDFLFLAAMSQRGIVSSEKKMSLDLRLLGALVFSVSSAIFLVSLPFWFNFPFLGLIPVSLSLMGVIGGHDLAQVGVNMRNVQKVVQPASSVFGQIRNVVGGALSIGEAIVSEADGTPWHLKNTWAFQYFPSAKEIFKIDSTAIAV